MNNIINNLDQFLNETDDQNIAEENKVNIKTKDGLIERTLIEKKLVVADGRELLREDMPISFSKHRIV